MYKSELPTVVWKWCLWTQVDPIIQSLKTSLSSSTRNTLHFPSYLYFFSTFGFVQYKFDKSQAPLMVKLNCNFISPNQIWFLCHKFKKVSTIHKDVHILHIFKIRKYKNGKHIFRWDPKSPKRKIIWNIWNFLSNK